MGNDRENKIQGGVVRPPAPVPETAAWAVHRIPGHQNGHEPAIEASLMWELILHDLLSALPLED